MNITEFAMFKKMFGKGGNSPSFVRTITFQNGNIGNTMMPDPISGIIGTEINLPTPKLNNYNFAGWYLDYACTTPFEETTFSENLTLYAKWVSNTSEQITVLSYYANGSGTLNDSSPIRKAVASAGNPDIICLQSVGQNWVSPPSGYNNTITGYTHSPQNKNTKNCFILYKTDKFTPIASNYNAYFSYIVLQRKSDGAWFTVINAWFGNDVTEETKLEQIWERIDGIWKDAGRGCMPMIIAGSFGSNMTADSVAYKGLTENSVFVDSSEYAKLFQSEANATLGDYVFASYHMKDSVESYNLLTNTGIHYGLVVNVAIPDVCPHILTKTEANDATCETAGNKEYYTCSSCGKVYADEYGTIETTVEDCVIPPPEQFEAVEEN